MMSTRAQFKSFAYVNCSTKVASPLIPGCYPVDIGGYSVKFSGQQMLHGKYGGEESKPCNPGDLLGYQFYNIRMPSGNTISMRFQTTIPVRLEPIDGRTVASMEVFHPDLGKGDVYGVLNLQKWERNLISIMLHFERSSHSKLTKKYPHFRNTSKS